MSETEQQIAPETAAVPEIATAPVEAVAEAVAEAPVAEPVIAEAPAVVAKPRRGRKPKAAPVAEPAVVAAPVKVKAKPGPKPKAKTEIKVKAAPKAKPATKPEINEKKPAKLPIKKLAVKRAVAQPAPKKETIAMATKTKTTDFTAKIQDTFKESTEKAKAVFGDAGEFAKGNVEAVVASSKILATGVKSMGEAYVAETKSAYETMTADLKEFAAVKSPTEFFELQSKLLRKNFDAAVATGSKKSEETLKLVNEAFQPISTRLSLAMEKIKKAA